MDLEATEQKPFSTIGIGFEKQDELDMNIIEILPATCKQEPPDGETFETVVKIEKVEPVVNEVISLDSQVKEESSSNIQVKEESSSNIQVKEQISLDDADEGFSGVKTEELMIKNEPECDSDSRQEDNDLEGTNSYSKRMYDDGMANKHKCDYCTYITNDKEDLKVHMLENCKEIRNMHCCDYCGYKTFYSSLLRMHILAVHDKNSIKKYACDTCIFKSHNKSDLKKHISLTHNKKDAAKKYACDKCAYRSHYKSNLNRHKLKHEREASKIQEDNDLEGNNSYSKRMYDDGMANKHKCDYCTYITNDKEDLKVHMLENCKEIRNMQACDYCGYQATCSSYLKIHISAVHDKNSIKKYACDTCDFKSHYKSVLKKHIYLTHNKDAVKKHACDHCGYRSHFKNNLKRHKLKHEREASKM